MGVLKVEVGEKIARISTPAGGEGQAQAGLAHALPSIATVMDGPSLRAAGLALLLFSVTVDHYTLGVVGLSIKAEHIVALGLFVLLLVSVTRHVMSGETSLRWNELLRWPLLWLGPYFGVTLLSSLINAPDPGTSLRHTVMITLVAASAVVVYWLADTVEMARLGVKMVVVFGALEAVYTFVTLIAANFSITLGTQPGNGKIIVPYGSLWEPNLLGSYLAAGGVLLLSFLFVVARRRQRVLLALGLTLIVVALALSLARASWIGFVVGASVVALLYFLVSKKGAHDLHVNWARIWTLLALSVGSALAFLILVAPLFFPTTVQGIFIRINPQWYDPAKDPAIIERVTSTRGALDNITSHLIVGNGAGSYGETHTDAKGNPGWISNLELHILYDSGVVGLLAFVLGLAFMLWQALGALFRARDYPQLGTIRPEIIGLVGALATLLIAFQATEGTWMAFFWVYVGLLASISQWTVNDPKRKT